MRIAVFGLTTPETEVSVSPAGIANVEFLDPVHQAQLLVDKLRRDHDVIIGLVHLGVHPFSKYTSTLLAQRVKGIDVIIDGHSHTVLPQGIMEGDTLICQTGCYDSYLGEVNVTVKNHAVVEKSARLLDPGQAAALAPVPDAKVLSEISRMEKAYTKEFRKVVGHSGHAMEYDRKKDRTGETELGDFVTDAFRSTTGADIAVVNSGSVRAGWPAGEVTKGDVINVFPYGNLMKKAEVSGEQILEMLENSVSLYPGDAGRFLQVSGLSFTVDAAKPVGSRVSDVLVKGEPLDPKGKYTMAVSDFMLQGGDGYQMLKGLHVIAECGTQYEIMEAWAKEHSGLESPMGRIRILHAAGREAEKKAA